VAHGRLRADFGGLFLALQFTVAFEPGAWSAKPCPGPYRLFFRVFPDRQQKPRTHRRQTRTGLSFCVPGLEELFSHFGHDAHGFYTPAPSRPEGVCRDDLFYNGIGPDPRQLTIFPAIFSRNCRLGLRPSGDSRWNAGSFQFEKEAFFVLPRKSRGCAEAYMGMPHKQARRLTPPGRKRTLSGWKLGLFLTRRIRVCALI